jgi:hypothetical protein
LNSNFFRIRVRSCSFVVAEFVSLAWLPKQS